MRGAVATWTDRCPLEGTCTECGLTFEWRYVLMIARYEPRWSVEFAPGWRRVPRAALSTLLRSCRPWHFWKKMHMSSRVRWRRMLAYLSLLLCVLLLPYVATQTTRAIMVRSQVMSVLNMYALRGMPSIAMYEQAIADVERGVVTEEMVGVPIEEYVQRLRVELAAAKAATPQEPSVDMSYFDAVLEALLYPSGQYSKGTMTDASGMNHLYPAPGQYTSILWTLSNAGPTWFGPNVRRTDLTPEALVIRVGACLTLVLLLPVSFILLPASRRRAKVQWRHIGRIAIYSLGVPAIILTVLMLGIGLRTIPQTYAWVPELLWQLPILLWVYLPVFWWAAIKRYLHMPHAFAVAFLMTFMIALMCAPFWIATLPPWMRQLLL